MKSIIFIVIASVVFISAEIAENLHTDELSVENFRKAEIKCGKKYLITEEEVKNFEAGHDGQGPAFKCYAFCVFTTFGTMTENGEHIVDKVLALVSDKEKPIVEKCLQIKGRDVCDKPYLSYKCYRDGVIIPNKSKKGVN